MQFENWAQRLASERSNKKIIDSVEQKIEGKVKHKAIINGKSCIAYLTPADSCRLGDNPFVQNYKR